MRYELKTRLLESKKAIRRSVIRATLKEQGPHYEHRADESPDPARSLPD